MIIELLRAFVYDQFSGDQEDLHHEPHHQYLVPVQDVYIEQLLGLELFPKVVQINRVQAGKLTGMLLEQENSKLTRMLDDDGYLTEEINKALNMLKTRK